MSSHHHNRLIGQDEELIYNHLLHWVELETPEQLVDRFHALFIDGARYPDAEILEALDRVTASKTAAEDFRYVLNRCCHILINRWQTRLQSQMAIPELIGLFETVSDASSKSLVRARSVRRLRELVKHFVQTEQYVTMRRLATVLNLSVDGSSAVDNRPLGTLIRRYPYLYSHCLLSEDSSFEQQNTVRQIQSNFQRQFEIDLSQYITYQVRRSHVTQLSDPSRANRIIHPVANPTLLDNRDLGLAIRHYAGKVEGNRTYRDLALNFQTHSIHCNTYGAFKDDLYQYIVSAVDPEYGRRQFNNQFYKHLKETLPENNLHPVNDFLIVRTCIQLLNFLIVDSTSRPDHFVFVDLITNLGPILTTNILLKIVLFCRKVKPALERRLSILFNHYETSARAVVEWLIYALENLNVAFSTNFGSVNLTLVN